jgi:hypothetical protein
LTSTTGTIKIIYLDTVEPSHKNWFEKIEQSIKDTYTDNV